MQQLFDPTSSLGQTLFRLCLSVPWERFLVKAKVSPEASEVVVRAITPPKPRPVLASSMVPVRAALPEPVSMPPPVPRPAPTASLAPSSPSLAAIARPGCTAADSALLNLGYLDGLSRGLGGWGVLRVGKERLEEGAKAARQLRQPELATEMEAIAAELPNVHDEEAATVLAARLRPVADRAWSMGAKCKGTLSESDLAEIKALASKIAARQKE